MNQVFDNARIKVLSAFPSIYTKDDVIKLIDELQNEVTKQPQTDIATLEKLKQNLLAALERKIDNIDSSDVVDYDSVDLMISYRNQVEIESIDVNCSTLFDEISTVVNDEFDDYIEEDKVEATTEA
jgi:Txe/YoeB family toxin of Txe-Axe toxin-antitoxin module